MAVPKPRFHESQRDYISRCEKQLQEENQGKSEGEKLPARQISAICYATWRKAIKLME